MQSGQEDSIDEKLKLILRTWDVGNPSTALDERISASICNLENRLLRRHQPESPPSLEDRMSSSYCQEINHPFPRFARPLSLILRFAAIVIIGIAVLYAAIRIGPTLINSKGLRGSGTTSNPQNQPSPSPDSPRGANGVVMNSGERKTDAGSPESNNPNLISQTPTPVATMNSVQTRPGIGNPSYVFIDEIPPAEPAVGSEYILSGTVTTPQGVPLLGATVSLHSSGPLGTPLQWPAARASQLCDSEGRFTVRLRSPLAPAMVRVQKENFAAVEEPVSLGDPGTVVKNYELPAAVTCASGRVFAGENRPLAGATVMLSVIMGGSMKPSVSAIWNTTDESGRYMLPGLPAEALGGRMRLRTYARGFITDYSPFLELQPGPCKQVDIHLNPANIIPLVVKNRQGGVIPDASGTLQKSATNSNFFVTEAMSKGASPGTLEWIAALDAVPVPCTVSAKGYLPATFTLDPKSPRSEIVLEDGETLRGRVVSDTGNPVRGAKISVLGTRNTGRVPIVDTGNSDAEGKFVIPLSSLSVSQIRITKQDYAERVMTFDAAPCPPELEIQLQTAAAGIFGRVWDSENHPAKWFTVSFSRPDDMTPSGFIRNFRDGSFSIRDIQPGTYLVRISVEPEGAMDMPKGEPFVLSRLEIRRGYMYGPVDIHLQPIVKK